MNVAFAKRINGSRDGNSSSKGEFEGIANEVNENLAKTILVGNDIFRKILGDMKVKIKIFLFELKEEKLVDIDKKLTKIVLGWLENEFVVLYLLEIENRIHKVKE